MTHLTWTALESNQRLFNDTAMTKGLKEGAEGLKGC